MNQLAPVQEANALPALIDRAASALSNARSAAEVLEAKEMAGFAYDAAKRAARLAQAKGAHDEVTAAALRAQADANEIIAAAQRRLADEYDAAQDRGEVAKQGRPEKVASSDLKPTVADLGLSKQQISEARIARDAEKNDPGVTRRALDDKLAKGEEPTKAALRKDLAVAAGRTPKKVAGDPQADAIAQVVDHCRKVVASSAKLAPRYLIDGLRNEAARERGLQAICECRELLSSLLIEAGDEIEPEAPTPLPVDQGQRAPASIKREQRPAEAKSPVKEPSEAEGSGGVQDESAIHPAATFGRPPKPMRPYCQKPEACGGVGYQHCYTCGRIAAAADAGNANTTQVPA